MYSRVAGWAFLAVGVRFFCTRPSARISCTGNGVLSLRYASVSPTGLPFCCSREWREGGMKEALEGIELEVEAPM